MPPIRLPDLDLLLLGCGKMGGALLEGWLAAGARPDRIVAVEPTPAPELAQKARRLGFRLVSAPEPRTVDVLVLAVKPQVMPSALPAIAAAAVGPRTLTLSIAAGLPLAFYEAAVGSGRAVVRAMPNTPAAVGRGVAALVANAAAGAADRALAEALLGVVGDTLWLDREDLMDAVTAVSGSGPAYVFHLIEALAAAGEAEGLPSDVAMRLARGTVIGAGALAQASDDTAARLRENVTSPGGTTAAGLAELMHVEHGLGPLIRRTVAAAAARSRTLRG